MSVVMAEFSEWDSFYVIVGSAAGALIGLQFVVMTLIAHRPPKDMARAGAAFSSPTIAHFSSILFLAALLRAPWRTVTVAASLWGALGLGGVVYSGIVFRRMRRQTAYRPGLEDWVFYAVLPLGGYAALTASAIAALSRAREALFGVAGAALLLLFTAIHNSWDSITYQVIAHRSRREDKE